jgi:hypothetical protein
MQLDLSEADLVVPSLAACSLDEVVRAVVQPR